MLKTNFVAGDKILAADMNATNTDVNTLMSMKGRVELRPVEELPATGESGIIYLVPNGGTGTNTRDEYVWSENAWEKIGTTEIDLSEYAKKSEVCVIEGINAEENTKLFNALNNTTGSYVINVGQDIYDRIRVAKTVVLKATGNKFGCNFINFSTVSVMTFTSDGYGTEFKSDGKDSYISWQVQNHGSDGLRLTCTIS